MKSFMVMAFAIGLGAAGLSGCTSARGQQGAVIGGATGAVIGGVASHSVGGAVVGGAVGATAGYVIGKHSYPCRTRNVFGNWYTGTCFR
jgi:hypothetical protein